MTAEHPVLADAPQPILREIGATRRFLIRPVAGGKSTVFTPAPYPHW
jgi:hypothetical protein